VIDSYDLLIQHPIFIVGELYLQIRYQLLALPGVELDEIRTVFSHPQALAQTKDFLDAHPAMQPVAAYDTAGAAKMVAEEQVRERAAIAPPLAGTRYGLVPLATGIENDPENYTRMVVIGHQESHPSGSNVKTSVIAGLRHERGSLATLLGVLQEAGMNLTKIESRPIVGRPWEYLFYLDWEGRLENTPLAKAKGTAIWWKHLGVYPRGNIIPAV
jgi:prephenate dehydratase